MRAVVARLVMGRVDNAVIAAHVHRTTVRRRVMAAGRFRPGMPPRGAPERDGARHDRAEKRQEDDRLIHPVSPSSG